MKARGWEGGFCSILTDDSAEATIAASLAEPWDCIVIGGGIRIPSRGLPLFERVINAVHRGAPGTPIAFNTSPTDTADAGFEVAGEGVIRARSGGNRKLSTFDAMIVASALEADCGRLGRSTCRMGW